MIFAREPKFCSRIIASVLFTGLMLVRAVTNWKVRRKVAVIQGAISHGILLHSGEDVGPAFL